MSTVTGLPEEFFRKIADASALGPLFDYVPDVYLFVKDAEHRFVMVNRSGFLKHGCQSAAEMIGKTDWDFHPPVFARQYIEEDERVMSSGQPLPDQIWLVPGADGLPRWYVSTKMPLHDVARKVIGLACVMRPYEHAGQAPDHYRRMATAIEHVLGHLGDKILMSDLARLTHRSVSQFQREFQRIFQMAPRDYIFEVRLQAARRRLEISLDPLGQIAADCGFYDQSYFVKRFKTATGLRPLEYRRRFNPGVKANSGAKRAAPY